MSQISELERCETDVISLFLLHTYASHQFLREYELGYGPRSSDGGSTRTKSNI